jgi:hypothetical protein
LTIRKREYHLNTNQSPVREKLKKNDYLFRFVGCSTAGFAPNQLSKRPIGVACNERLSTVFSALFCNVGVRAVA